MKAKEKVLSTLEQKGLREQKTSLEEKSYSNFSYKVLQLFFEDYELLLTFICGFIANLPISVLFNILTLNDIDFCNILWVAYFIIYAICLISAIILTIFAFAVTTRYVKIKSGDKKLPERIDACIAQNGKKTVLNKLTKYCIWIIISFLVFVLSVIALFAVNTFLLG